MKNVFFGVTLALLATTTFAQAASCPKSSPEGYKWLSGYVDEFRDNGTVSDWFTDSLKKHPKDVALLGLKAFFDTKGDVDAARKLFMERGGSDKAFSVAMACSKIN